MQSVLEPDEKGSEYVDDQSFLSPRNDAKASGKMILHIKSRRVCVGSQVLSFATFDGRLGSAKMATRTERVAVYADVLDDEQSEALKNARALANGLGIELEVKDISKQSMFARFFGMILRNNQDHRTPALSLGGKAIESLVSPS